MENSTSNRKKRSRSPSYPIFDLKSAVDKARQFYKSDGFNRVAADIAPVCWGLTEQSSAGYRYIAALLQYGLFEDEGSGENRKVFLSELGKTIVIDERENSQELRSALKEAALKPQIYKQLWEKWGSDIPSDATIKYHLIKELEFNKNKVDKFIENFRSTINFANLAEVEDLSDDKKNQSTINQSDFKNQQSSVTKSQNLPSTKESENEGVLEIAIPLISGKQATLKIPRPLSGEDFELVKKLIVTYLDISKPAIIAKFTSNKPNEEMNGGTA